MDVVPAPSPSALQRVEWTRLDAKSLPDTGQAIILTTGCKTYHTVFNSALELRAHIREGGMYFQLVEAQSSDGQ